MTALIMFIVMIAIPALIIFGVVKGIKALIDYIMRWQIARDAIREINEIERDINSHQDSYENESDNRDDL